MTFSHEDLVRELTEQYSPILESSPDGVYLWLDDAHKICNERLASMFGYSVDDWCAQDGFLESFVAPEDQETYARNYQRTVMDLGSPVTFRFRARHKDGSTFAAETDMIPVAWRGHPVAYHFVRRITE